MGCEPGGCAKFRLRKGHKQGGQIALRRTYPDKKQGVIRLGAGRKKSSRIGLLSTPKNGIMNAQDISNEGGERFWFFAVMYGRA